MCISLGPCGARELTLTVIVRESNCTYKSSLLSLLSRFMTISVTLTGVLQACHQKCDIFSMKDLFGVQRDSEIEHFSHFMCKNQIQTSHFNNFHFICCFFSPIPRVD